MSQRNGARAAWRQLGSPDALSVPTYVVAVCFNLLIGLLSLQVFRGVPLEVILVGFAVSQVLMIGLLILAKATFLRSSVRRGRPWLTLAAFAVASMTVGQPLHLFVEWLGSVPTGTTGTGAPRGPVATFIALVLSALTAVALADQRRRRNLLVQRGEHLVRARAAAHEALDVRQEQTVLEITAMLADLVESISISDPTEVVTSLRRASQDIVRPLSHDLAVHSPTVLTEQPADPGLGLDWRRMLVDATSGNAIPPTILMVMIGAVSLLNSVYHSGVVIGGLSLLVALAALWVSAHLANRLLRRIVPRLGPVGRATALTICLMAIGAVATLAAWPIRSRLPGATPSFTGVWADVFIGWAIALVRATRQQADRTEAELDALNRDLEWEVSRANQLLRQQQRALARELHGPVQAAVNAAAIRLSDAVTEGTITSDQVSVELRLILGTLPGLATAGRHPVDVQLAFERAQATWSSLCTIRIDVDESTLDRLKQDAACSSSVADLVIECSSNAIRHGGATLIEVSITALGPQCIVIVADDNGTPIEADARPGMGTLMLDEVSLRWERIPHGDGTRLSAVLPIVVQLI